MSSVKHCLSLYVLLMLMLLVLLVLPRSAFLETQRFRLPAPPPAGAGASQPARTMDGYADMAALNKSSSKIAVAGAPQPGGPGPDAPPVGQDAPPVLPGKPSADCRDLHLPGAMSAASDLSSGVGDGARSAGGAPASGVHGHGFSLQEACSVVGEGLALCHWTWTREHVQALSYSVPRACAMVLAQPVLVECIHEALGRRPAARFRH